MTTINSMPMAEQRAPARPLRGSRGSQKLVDDMLRSNSLNHEKKKASERGMVKEFISLFRKSSPRLGNYKPTLDMLEGGVKKRDRLFSLWPFRKKEQPKQGFKSQRGRIRLPDSAVAGTTTDGHRHIAISIPIEHAHLEPAVRKPNIPTARPVGELDQGDGRKGRSQCSEKHRRSETPSITDSGPRFPPRSPTGPDNLASPCSAVATSTRELEPLKGSASTDTYLTNPWSEHRQTPCQQLARDRSTERGMLPKAGRSMDRQVLRKSSSSESFYTTTSELISSDAVTVCIPSPESPDSQKSLASETSTDRHSVEPTPSRTAIYGRDTQKGASTGENNSQDFNHLVPYNESSSRTSSVPNPIWPFPSSHTDGSCQPHALSNITSLRSLLPSSLDPRALHVARIMTVADIKPSFSHRAPLHSGICKTSGYLHYQYYLTRIPDFNNEKRPRRAHSVSNIRSTNHSYASPPVAQPSNEEAGTSTPHLTTVANSDTRTSHAITSSNNPTSPHSSCLGPHENEKEQTDSESESEGPSDREADRNTEVDLLYRYTARLSRIHDREMNGLLTRIDNLERANTRLTSTVVPLLQRVSCQLRSISSSCAGDRGSARMGYFPEAEAGGGADGGVAAGGAGAGAGVAAGVNALRRSPSSCSVRRSGASDSGSGYYDRGGVFTPTRLESIVGLGSGALEEEDDRRHRISMGVCNGSGSGNGGGGGGRRGVRDSGVTGISLPGDMPRLRAASFANAGYLDSSSTDVVFDTPPYCRGALMPPDGTPPMSMSDGSSRGDDDRETTVSESERQADLSVRQQQSESGNLPPQDQEDEDEGSGDASGLGAIEGLMRELIPTTRLKD